MKKIIIIFLSMIFFSVLEISTALACKVSTSKALSLGVTTKDNLFFSYGLKSLDDFIPYSTINNCTETAIKKKYLMLAFGPEVVDESDTARGTNFNRVFLDPVCAIFNNPLKEILTAAQKKKIFEKKWKFISECVEILVSEEGNNKLNYPQDQIGCEVTSLTPHSAFFKGGYCFFQPYADSIIKTTVTISKSCQDIESYRDLGINLQDINANLSFYTSTKYKDDLSDLTALATTPVRISTNPIPPLILPSEDFGIVRPVYPAIYPLNDIHLGKIEFIDLKNKNIAIKTPLIVSNVCKEVESDHLKSSICDYATPFVAQITFKNDLNQIEANWFDGGIAPAQWQGVIGGEGFQLMKESFTTNKNYKLEIVFSDPYFEFNTFKGRIKNKISSINAQIPRLGRDGNILDIPIFHDLKEIDQMMEIDPIGNVNFARTLVGLANSRRRLNNYFSTTMYPPIYTSSCDISKNRCISLGKPFLTFVASFFLNIDYSVSNLKIERTSSLLESYSKSITDQPEYKCPQN